MKAGKARMLKPGGMTATKAGLIGCLGIIVIMVLAYLRGNNPLEMPQQVETNASGSFQESSPIPSGHDTQV